MNDKSDPNPGDIAQIRDDIDRIDADILKLAERKRTAFASPRRKVSTTDPLGTSREKKASSPIASRPGWSTISTRVW